MPSSIEIKLTRGSKSDVVVCTFPSVPDRTRLHTAYREAVGYRGESETAVADFNVQDFAAVCLAMVGLSWSGSKLPDLPTFRECGRDVVAYGEAVASALFFAGYSDVQEQVDAGRTLHTAMMSDMAEGAKRASEGFPTAPRVS